MSADQFSELQRELQSMRERVAIDAQVMRTVLEQTTPKTMDKVWDYVMKGWISISIAAAGFIFAINTRVSDNASRLTILEQTRFSRTDAADLENALKTFISSSIVPPWLKESIEKMDTRVERIDRGVVDVRERVTKVESKLDK